MKGVPEDRRKLYQEIREQAQVAFTKGIKETKEELDAEVEAFEPGSHTLQSFEYSWRLARFPYFGSFFSNLFSNVLRASSRMDLFSSSR